MTVRWGILGCGDVCEIKSGPGFKTARGSELVAVMRRDGRLAEDFARRHGVPAFYDQADRLIEDPNVSAVYIATPPGSHLELALKVAAAGKPAYVEKPMARSHEECATMVEAFARARQPLFVAYYRRALPRFVKAKELIDSGRLGVDELLGSGRCPSTGVTAARTSAVMDRALAGYYGSRGGEFWKHPERWPGRPL